MPGKRARRLLSIPMGAAAIGVTPWSLRQEIASGEGPPTVRVGKREWLDLDDLDRWFDSRRAVSRTTSDASNDDMQP
jgi:hypothetical protein